jgi:hypothetical protein
MSALGVGSFGINGPSYRPNKHPGGASSPVLHKLAGEFGPRRAPENRVIAAWWNSLAADTAGSVETCTYASWVGRPRAG